MYSSIELDLIRSEIMKNDNEYIAQVFKAFCDPNRIIILKLLKNGSECPCMLQEKLNIGQSTLSHHLKVLHDAGIIECEKKGKWTQCSLSKEGCKNAKKLLNQILDSNV